MTFKDYFAVVDTRSRCYFSFEDEEDQYFDHGYIHIYGIPDNLSDDEESSIYNGGSDRTVYLGEIKGSLISSDIEHSLKRTQQRLTTVTLYMKCSRRSFRYSKI